MSIDDDAIASYRDLGYWFSEASFSREEIQVLKDQLLLASEIDAPQRVLEKDGKLVRSIYGLHQTNDVFRNLIRDPRLLGMAERILEDRVYVHQFKVNAKPAFGGDIWEWHQDYIFWKEEDGMPTDRVVNAVLFLDEVNEFNGPLMFIPRSHLQGVISERSNDSANLSSGEPSWHSNVSANLKYTISKEWIMRLVQEHGLVAPKGTCGSVLFFHSNLVHGSLPNMSPFDRKVAIITYNSVSNKCNPSHTIRPEFLAGRDFTQL